MKRLLWIDLETSGLDPEGDQILEVAATAAPYDDPFTVGPMYHTVLRLKNSSQFSTEVKRMHNKNGLFAEARESRVNINAVERHLMTMVPDANEKEDDLSILAGSSVHFDHGFIRCHMPVLAMRLSHRYYDVSAIKMFCETLGMKPLAKKKAHRAEKDIIESIEHAKHCQEWIKSLSNHKE